MWISLVRHKSSIGLVINERLGKSGGSVRQAQARVCRRTRRHTSNRKPVLGLQVVKAIAERSDRRSINFASSVKKNARTEPAKREWNRSEILYNAKSFRSSGSNAFTMESQMPLWIANTDATRATTKNRPIQAHNANIEKEKCACEESNIDPIINGNYWL